MRIVLSAAALWVCGIAEAATVEHGISVSVGASRIADYYWYDQGMSVLLGYERRFVGAFGGFVGYRLAYGASRIRTYDVKYSTEWAPWGEADVLFGTTIPQGPSGLMASVGLGTDVVVFVPTPIALSCRLGARGQVEDGPIVEAAWYLRGMALPVPVADVFPGLSRWSSGVEASIRW